MVGVWGDSAHAGAYGAIRISFEGKGLSVGMAIGHPRTASGRPYSASEASLVPTYSAILPSNAHPSPYKPKIYHPPKESIMKIVITARNFSTGDDSAVRLLQARGHEIVDLSEADMGEKYLV